MGPGNPKTWQLTKLCIQSPLDSFIVQKYSMASFLPSTVRLQPRCSLGLYTSNRKLISLNLYSTKVYQIILTSSAAPVTPVATVKPLLSVYEAVGKHACAPENPNLPTQQSNLWCKASKVLRTIAQHEKRCTEVDANNNHSRIP